MATVESINPFPNDVRNAFQEYITSDTYINRDRIQPQHWQRIHVFVDNPTLKPDNQTDANIKYQAIHHFELIDRKLYRQPDAHHPDPRYVVPENEIFDVIATEHLKLLHAGRNKVWPVIERKYHGIKRADVEWVIKRCKNCTLNRPVTTKAPLEPIVSERAFERVQADLIDMRHEPSSQYKWILHIKDHFGKYSQLYTLKSKESKPIAQAFAQFIMAFLPLKIVQCDNSKEFKGAFFILLRKYGIRIINRKPRSSQTQGLVEQANGVVEAKIRAWKMDNSSTEWADGLVEITLAINTQKHLTINCAPVELLFRDCSTYIDWLDSQKRKDPAIRVLQEDSNEALIYALDSEPELMVTTQSNVLANPQVLTIGHSRVDIDIHSQSHSQVIMRISPKSGSEINIRITPPIRNSPEQWFDIETNIQASIKVESSITTTTATTATAIQSTDLVI
ncbi:hypothetical protein B7463_g5574, partial [Scytalidium lignicola]